MIRNLPAAIKPASDNKGQKRLWRDYCYFIERYFDAYECIVRITEINLEPFGIQICMDTALGTPVNKILKHQLELAKLLGAPRQKIIMEAPIPGRSLIGITIPWVYPEPPQKRTLRERPLRNAIRTHRMNMCIRLFKLAEKFGGPIYFQI